MAAITVTSSLWHSRLGHASLPRVKLLASQGRLGLVNFQSFDCVSCHLEKQTCLSFNKSESFSSAPFDLIHSDIWGPAPIPTEGGSHYFVILWMITVVILGFIFYRIDQNSLIFTRISTKWCKLNFLVPLKLFVQIMQWNTRTSCFLLSYSKMGQSLITLIPTPHNKMVE
jgi:hypothetical protein